ncbi:MAG: hypothetical protein M1818_005930 [Claussenomyces sp. TS43310]|nr:MAG: hypothetical protein M1818_005930 [Claussenomyces sp. TS43310]
MALSFGSNWQGSFGAPAAQTAATSDSQAQSGPDLEEIQTEGLGFLSVAGEAKVQLLPSPWPTDNLPPPTASLLSVASQKGLVAAAGPDAVVIATTDSVRKAFEGPKSGEGHVRAFQPPMTLPMPMRVSQVAFTADEHYLVLSAESGGGLAVYEVQSIINGSTTSAFELSTNSLSVRAIIPNPTQEKGELLALLTTDGKLMMANLKEKNFIAGSNGQILKEGVSCASWSTRGKQLLAGLGDGTAFQMTPEGEGKAEIPRPPNVDSNHHVSSISWLENNVFLTVHTPTNFDNSTPPSSDFHIVTRSTTTPPAFMFQRIADPATPFGLNRSPPHHFLLRLKDFPPNLQDLLIVGSTTSSDIGLFSRSKTPLVSGQPADKVSGVFTMTGMSDDSRRAELPMTEDMSDTSPIGLALDLSSRDKVVKPIPSDEMDESQTPVPGLMVLNNEGVLAAWWIIYSESIRQGTIYPGLVAAGGTQLSAPVQSQAPAAPQPSPFGNSATKQAFGQPSFGAPSSQASAFGGFNKPAAPAFGSSSALGTGTGTGAFGATSALNRTPSLWGASATNAPKSGSMTSGTPVFGSSSTPNAQNVAFGSSAMPGSKVSPWNQSTNKPAGGAFGQTSGLGMAAPSAFGAKSGSHLFGSGSTAAAPSSGGFASFANSGGFASVTAKAENSGSVFGSGSNGFAGTPSTLAMGNGSSFGSFGSKPSEASGAPLGGKGFTLGSAFKPDESSKDEALKPNNAVGSSLFGSSFSSALGDASKVPETMASPEADMDADEPDSLQQPKTENAAPQSDQASAPTTHPSTTPASTPAAPKFALQTTTPPGKGGLFGTPVTAKPPTTSQAGLFGAPAASVPPATSSTAGFTFGKPFSAEKGTLDGQVDPKTPLTTAPETSQSRADPASTSKPLFGTAPETPEPVKIKQEPDEDDNAQRKTLESVPEAPLAPDITSKSSYAAGDTSGSSAENDAPLPPDFMPKPAAKTTNDISKPPAQIPSAPAAVRADLIPPTDVPGGPDEEDDDSDFANEDEDEEDQGEDEGEEGDEEEGASEFEGSGEDVTKDLSPISESNQTPGFTPQSSFGGILNRGDDTFTKISRPVQGTGSRSLFGEISSNSAMILPPPKPLTSPRSPSPVRASIPGRLRPEKSRSISTPGTASQLLAAKRNTGAPTTTYALTLEQRRAEERHQAEAKAKREAEESQALVDEEDVSVQRYLDSDVVGTLHLDEFIAHQDYVGHSDKNSIPAQVEAVYRDINSMIDTLGINARALKSFMKGHTEQYKDPPRTKEDLEGDDEWCLVEIENLRSIIEKELTKELAEGCVKDVAGKLEICNDLERDLAKLRAKHDDLKMIMATQTHPEQIAAIRSQPLTTEQAAQQHDLRRDYTNVQKLLAEAEESLTLLRVKLAAQTGGISKAGSGPTVEAVTRTIMKMTNMAEKRSGDIDVLENQMRKLRMSSVTSNGSREASPFATPLRSSARSPGKGSSHALFYTPESVRDSPSRFRNSMRSSVNSHGGDSPARKKMSGFTDDDKRRLKSDAARRKDVMDRLKAALAKSGTRMRLMDDEGGD